MKNCYVAPGKDYALYPPLPSGNNSSSEFKSITIKVKSEASTPANNLLYTHDTRCRKKKCEIRLVIPVASPLLNLLNHARALALLTPTVPSPTKSSPTKKSKSGERFVGCCNCSLKSQCSTLRCACKKLGLSCSECRSSCCMNVDKVLPSIEIHDTEPDNLSANKLKDPISEDLSTQYKHVQFPPLDTFTPPRLKTVSPISVTETESDDLIEELKKDEEESSNENEKEKDKSTKNSPTSEGSYSTVGDLKDYITTPMDRKLVEVFDSEYIRANGGTQLDGGIVDDNLW